MKKTSAQFWEWFKEHHHDYLQLDQVDEDAQEDLLDAMQDALHGYCDELFFDIGLPKEGVHEFIVTAEGETKYFHHVEKLIAEAPSIAPWKFIAFVPPIGTDFTFDYEGIKLLPKNMWFLPLENPKDKDSIGIKICCKEFLDLRSNKAFLPSIYTIVDMIVGEKIYATEIDHIEAGSLPDDPEMAGMLPLADLMDYIEDFRMN
mgnify:CR=1 FL=1